MLQAGHTAYFDSGSNAVTLSPIKELVKTYGGKERITTHETLHSYLHNLRRAFAHQDPNFMFGQTNNAVFGKVLTGENGYILSGLKDVEINGQKAFVYDHITVPQFSKKERESIFNFICKTSQEDISPDKFGYTKLSKKGQKSLFESVVPQMEDYKKYLELRSEKPKKINAKIYSKVKNYINAMLFRRDFLWGSIANPSLPDIKQNIATPLTDIEKNIAVNSLNGLLSTHEGNIIQQQLKGLSGMANKTYLLSYEEKMAREEENISALREINKKLDISNLPESEKLTLNNKKIRLQKDAKLLNLLGEYTNLEQEIISAPKDPKKLARTYKVAKKALPEEVEIFFKALKKYSVNTAEFLECKTQEDVLRISSDAKKKLPSKLHKLFDDFASGKFNEIILKGGNNAEKTLSPTASLLSTPENINLIKKYRSLLKNLRELAKDSEIHGLPRFLFKSDKDYAVYMNKYIQVITKWANKILK